MMKKTSLWVKTEDLPKIEINSKGVKYMHEERCGLITSLSIHIIISIPFFVLSVSKNNEHIKTYYIQFTEIREQPVQPAETSKEIKRPKAIPKAIKKDIVQTQHKEEVKKETPLIKEDLPIQEYEEVIRNDTIESHEVVNVATPPEPQPQSQANSHQDNNSTVGNVSGAAPTNTDTAAVIETEFGLTGAPAFLKRQMPIYPMMARKLGKEGKVVLKLFINEEGRLLDVEVVEGAPYGFTESALKAVKMSTFLPARNKKGINVASKALLTIHFVLE